jgi:hypothetical protein
MYTFIFNLLKTWIFKTSSWNYKSPELDTYPAKKVRIAEKIVFYAQERRHIVVIDRRA